MHIYKVKYYFPRKTICRLQTCPYYLLSNVCLQVSFSIIFWIISIGLVCFPCFQLPNPLTARCEKIFICKSYQPGTAFHYLDILVYDSDMVSCSKYIYHIGIWYGPKRNHKVLEETRPLHSRHAWFISVWICSGACNSIPHYLHCLVEAWEG